MSVTGTRRTQTERRTAAEQALVEAAAKVIGEQGLAGVTLANVGERAGYSRGLATHYFGSKSALIQRVGDAVTEQFTSLLSASDRSDSPFGDLVAYVRTYTEVVSVMLPINRARLMMTADAIANPAGDAREAVIELNKVVHGHLRLLVKRAVKAGELDRSVDTAALATVVVGVLRGVSFEALLDPSIDVAKAGQEVERMLRAISRVSK